MLLYDLTSTYFASDPPLDENDKRRHGYSRDHRFDCVQIVIALMKLKQVLRREGRYPRVSRGLFVGTLAARPENLALLIGQHGVDLLQRITFGRLKFRDSIRCGKPPSPPQLQYLGLPTVQDYFDTALLGGGQMQLGG